MAKLSQNRGIMMEKTARTARDPEKTFAFSRILIPIDFSDRSQTALAYGVALSQRFGASLVLLHVLEPGMHSTASTGMTAVADEMNHGLIEMARERLQDLRAKRVPGRVQTETLVRIGRAYSEIPDTARALGADLIIVGAHGRTGLQNAILGSTAERVVRQAHCPVLSVHEGDTAQLRL